MGKVGAAVINDGIDGPYHAAVPPNQCGATRGKGTDLATHLLRSVQDYAKMHYKSLAIVFVDLSKAFDKIVREIVMGWFDKDWPIVSEQERRKRCVDTLCGHGLSRRQAKKLARIIEAGFVLGEAGVDPTQYLCFVRCMKSHGLK